MAVTFSCLASGCSKLESVVHSVRETYNIKREEEKVEGKKAKKNEMKTK